MKSYYLYFVLLVFCLSACCKGQFYGGDEFISTGVEQIYFLEGKKGNPIILHIEKYNWTNTCKGEIERSPMFTSLHSFNDSIDDGIISLELYDEKSEKLIDSSLIDLYNFDSKDKQQAPLIQLYMGQWKEVNYSQLSEQNLILKTTSSVLKNEYFLSDDVKMDVFKSIPLNKYTEGNLNILKTKNNQKSALQLAFAPAEIIGRGIYMELWKTDLDSALSTSPLLYSFGRTSVFLPLPQTSNFDGYVKVYSLQSNDSLGITIPIRF